MNHSDKHIPTINPKNILMRPKISITVPECAANDFTDIYYN